MSHTHRARIQLAREAKAIVVLALRNAPVEEFHAGKQCPTCFGRTEYSHVSGDEMHFIMQNAANRVFKFLVLRSGQA
jgi:hypothetical protein